MRVLYTQEAIAQRAAKKRYADAHKEEIKARREEYQKSKRGKALRKQYRKANAVKLKLARVRKVYGITDSAYKDLLKRHFNGCAICRAQSKLVIDHDHKKGKVRGMLCVKCNITTVAGVENAVNGGFLQKILDYLGV